MPTPRPMEPLNLEVSRNLWLQGPLFQTLCSISDPRFLSFSAVLASRSQWETLTHKKTVCSLKASEAVLTRADDVVQRLQVWRLWHQRPPASTRRNKTPNRGDHYCF